MARVPVRMCIPRRGGYPGTGPSATGPSDDTQRLLAGVAATALTTQMESL